MTAELFTIADVASRCGVAVRTVQRHAVREEIGRTVGGMRVFTASEADRLATIVSAARPGRPKRD